MSAIAKLTFANLAGRNDAVDFESAGLHKPRRRAKVHRVKQVRVIGLRTTYSTATLMPFNPFVDRKVVNSTLRPIRYASGKSLPDLKREIQHHVGRVRSLLNCEGESDDSLNKSVRGTASEAIDDSCVSRETTARMEEVVEPRKPQARSKLEENVARLEAKFEPHLRGGTVGKTEGREIVSTDDSCVSRETTARMEEVVEPRKPQARSKLEENVARLEAKFEPHLRGGIVGKTEGREIVSTPGSFPEGVEGTLSKTRSQNAPSHLEQNVRKLEQLFGTDGQAGIVSREFQKDSVGKIGNQIPPSVDKAENQNAPWKLDEKGGKAEKVEVKPVENQGSTESIPSDQVEQRKILEKTETCLLPKEGNLHAGFVIQLAAKGSREAEYVEKLKTGDGLKLPDGGVVTTTASGVSEAFKVNAYLESLSTSQFGRLVLYSSLIPSTQTLLSQNFHSFPAGTICIAAAQLQGKGRGGNVWQSPKGCLMFSFTTEMTNGRMVPFLQYVVSLAVIEALEETCKASRIPSPDVRIKWPNDLYAKGLKIGGVLCTSSYRAKTFNIVVGVGLNIGNREPTTCLNALIEELYGGSSPIPQELLLAAIMSRFEILNKIFQEQGFLPLQEAYYRKWLHSGQSVILEEREPGSSSISHVAVTIQGLTPMGYLLASDDEGERYELHPDGNSFDFLKGLVRQKLPV